MIIFLLFCTFRVSFILKTITVMTIETIPGVTKISLIGSRYIYIYEYERNIITRIHKFGMLMPLVYLCDILDFFSNFYFNITIILIHGYFKQ